MGDGDGQLPSPPRLPTHRPHLPFLPPPTPRPVGQQMKAKRSQQFDDEGGKDVSQKEESSRSGNDSTKGLRPLHRRERNPERPRSNSHGDWPFLRPPERVPEVPVVIREHLPQLEKIQEVLPSRCDEAHFC